MLGMTKWERSTIPGKIIKEFIIILFLNILNYLIWSVIIKIIFKYWGKVC